MVIYIYIEHGYIYIYVHHLIIFSTGRCDFFHEGCLSRISKGDKKEERQTDLATGHVLSIDAVSFTGEFCDFCAQKTV